MDPDTDLAPDQEKATDLDPDTETDLASDAEQDTDPEAEPDTDLATAQPTAPAYPFLTEKRFTWLTIYQRSSYRFICR